MDDSTAAADYNDYEYDTKRDDGYGSGSGYGGGGGGYDDGIKVQISAWLLPISSAQPRLDSA